MERDQSRFEGEDGGPSVLEDVQADGARDRRDVRVVDFGDEFHLDGLERVGFGDGNVLFCLVQNIGGRLRSPPRLNEVNHLVATIEQRSGRHRTRLTTSKRPPS